MEHDISAFFRREITQDSCAPQQSSKQLPVRESWEQTSQNFLKWPHRKMHANPGSTQCEYLPCGENETLIGHFCKD